MQPEIHSLIIYYYYRVVVDIAIDTELNTESYWVRRVSVCIYVAGLVFVSTQFSAYANYYYLFHILFASDVWESSTSVVTQCNL